MNTFRGFPQLEKHPLEQAGQLVRDDYTFVFMKMYVHMTQGGEFKRTPQVKDPVFEVKEEVYPYGIGGELLLRPNIGEAPLRVGVHNGKKQGAVWVPEGEKIGEYVIDFRSKLEFSSRVMPGMSIDGDLAIAMGRAFPLDTERSELTSLVFAAIEKNPDVRRFMAAKNAFLEAYAPNQNAEIAR